MGIAGRIARAFLKSKLTPLITVASLIVGAIGILATPREEEPQISVPMIDVVTAMPGATPREVENLLTRPIERRMWEIPGVEYVYSASSEGMSLVTVRFKKGTQTVEAALEDLIEEKVLVEDKEVVKPYTPHFVYHGTAEASLNEPHGLRVTMKLPATDKPASLLGEDGLELG